MNQITVFDHNGQLVTDSREVAEMVDKRHDHLLRDIHGYVEILQEATAPNFGVSDFFIPSTYQDGTGRTLPCYLITRKGCDMVANKMIGEKGVLFSAAYVTKFVEMEKSLAPQPIASIPEFLLQTAQAMVAQERQINALTDSQARQEQTIQKIKDALAPTDKVWRKWVNDELSCIAQARGNDYKGIKEESYEILERRAGCNLTIRLRNLKDRLKEQGRTKTTINNANRLDVIEVDKRLREIYTAIIKELSIKYLA